METVKPIVELRERSLGNPYGGKTFYFVDPILYQLEKVHGLTEFAKEFAEKTKLGWMDYYSCLEIVNTLVEIRLVDVYSETVWASLSKVYPNKKNVYGEFGYKGYKG